MRIRLLVGIAFGLFATDRATAQPPPPDDALQAFAASLKPLLAAAVPPVLYEQSTNWGHQEMAADGIRFHGLRTEVRKVPKNDGVWKRVRVTTQELPRSLSLAITDFQAIDGERSTFKVLLTLQVGVEYEQQNWDLGVRMWSGSVRARLQLHVALDCESLLRTEPGKGLLPDLVFRLRVTKAQVSYDHLVVEHIAGIGGTAARLLGDALHSGLRQWKPSIERNLLARTEAAIVRAADTREVRIGLGGLVKK